MEEIKNQTNVLSQQAEPESEKKVHKKKKINVGSQILLILTLLFVLAPFYIMVITSVMTLEEGNSIYKSLWPKRGFDFHWYQDALFDSAASGIPLLLSFFNTIWIYVPSVVLGIFSSTLAAYAFAKLDFKLKNMMFAVLMFTMMLPNSMALISSKFLFDVINWTGTPLPLMVPRMFGAIGVVFFVRQYFAGIPTDIMNAARIDGAGDWGVFFHIMLGIAKPAMFAQFILQFLSAYNDYMGPLLYLPLYEPRLFTLQIALKRLTGAFSYNPPQPFFMAAALVAMLPIVVLYVCAQKVIMQGIAMSAALKG